MLTSAVRAKAFASADLKFELWCIKLQKMSSIGAEAWACGRPVFYNVCISLSKMSGPVIHDHPAPPPAPAPAMPQKPHTQLASAAPEEPVLTQPTARKEMGGGEVRCKCEGGGIRRKIGDRRGHRCGRARALRVGGDMWPGVGAGLKEEAEEEEAGEEAAGAQAREALHRTVITLTGEGEAGRAPADADAAHARHARRYSTVVSLEAGGRALCTSRALDDRAGGKEGEEGDADGFLLRKVSHTSDYSLSSHSDSSVSSASPAPSRRTSQDTAHDSDYYGSSGEEEEERGEEGGEKNSAKDSDSEDEDVSGRLRAAMARLQASEASRLGFRRTAGGLRASRRWRRRAPIKVSGGRCWWRDVLA